MRFAVLAKVVVAAACVTLVAAATLDRREPQFGGLNFTQLFDNTSGIVVSGTDPSPNRRVSPRAVVAPVP